MIKPWMTLLLTLGMLLGASGCNTIAGAGEDVQAGGEAVEGAARDTQRGM